METDVNAIPVNLAAAGIDPLHLPALEARQVQAAVLRLDKIHPVVSGNKWFKLKYHLEEARRGGHSTLITFGGAYSNHLVATACACYQQGFQAVGIVRGEKGIQPSPTLQTAASYGMKLYHVSRRAYVQKQADADIQELMAGYPHPYLVPEGGAGEAGIRGCKEISSLADTRAYTHLLCCIGTGTMFKGLLQSKTAAQQLIGIPVLKFEKDAQFMLSLNQFIEEQGSIRTCQLLPFHFGGYAKKTPALLRFMNWFYDQTGIPTDFVYTGKLMAACMELVERDFFPPGSRLLLIHSGGLQGNSSLPPHTLHF
ncbi:MAG: pyridoxal-phosphate dependent enzyme [Williamsia sp.]|nr:pyridoxal-phosphate dependent enzyme [Williamsia sp.]